MSQSSTCTSESLHIEKSQNPDRVVCDSSSVRTLTACEVESKTIISTENCQRTVTISEEDTKTTIPIKNCKKTDLRSSSEGTTQKSRKREATNMLLECVKRRTAEDESLYVPLQRFSEETPLIETGCDESGYAMDTSNLDLCDSASVTDSGIDVSSKVSSPAHSVDTFSSQDDVGEECPTVNMDVESDHPSPEVSSNLSSDAVSDPSPPAAIYEDLNCLHLSDEAVLAQNGNTAIASPISQSLFKHVTPTVHFSLKHEKVAPLPEEVLSLMKWKLSTITPVIIKEIVQKAGFSLLEINTSEEWLGTWGKHLKCPSFKRIKVFQKVNHFPGSFHLGRKDKLWDNYKRWQGRYGDDVYNFFPETFHLPNDMNTLKSAWEAEGKKCWIIKPPASARGTGVKVIHKWAQIPKDKPFIVQRYLSDPYLINGTKFDLRIYVFISSIEPLRVYMFEDGLVRFASEKYSLSNKSFSNRFVHLTNYSINKKSSSYTSNDDENSCQGHKWTLKTFWSYMAGNGVDIERIQERIVDMILKTIICTEGPICRLSKTYAKSTYNCYELFGFDVMLDKDLCPWLLEVNISPSLHTRSSLDCNVKAQMVKDMLNMAAFQVPQFPKASDSSTPDYDIYSPIVGGHKAMRNKGLTKREKAKHCMYTFHGEASDSFDILDDLTSDDVRCLIESEDEYSRRGAFVRIFPTELTSDYFQYFEHIRYYNLLLDAWEKQYHFKREEGIQHLQALCNQGFHLQSRIIKDTAAVPSA